MNRRHTLIIDSENKSTIELKNYLRMLGHVVYQLETVEQSIQALKKHQFSHLMINAELLDCRIKDNLDEVEVLYNYIHSLTKANIQLLHDHPKDAELEEIMEKSNSVIIFTNRLKHEIKRAKNPLPRNTVLVVDDCSYTRQQIVIANGPHAKYHTAGSYSEAANLIIGSSITPDYIMLDYYLPGVDGISAATKLHKLVPEAHIIGMSSCPDALRTFEESGFIKSVILKDQLFLKMLKNAVSA